MCDWCVPTKPGYVNWYGGGASSYEWVAEPDEVFIGCLKKLIEGPLELDIPYV